MDTQAPPPPPYNDQHEYVSSNNKVINHGKSTSTELSEIVAHQLIHCHSVDKFVQNSPSFPLSFNGSNLPQLTDVTANSSSLDDQYYSDITKQLLGNIECEYDGHAAASSSSSPNQQHVTMKINDAREEHTTSSVGISSLFKELEIGKTAIGYILSALVALLINTAAFPRLALYAVVIAFCIGLTLTWNGIMLSNHDLEQIGVVVVFMGFFGLVASILPLVLAWVPLLCGVLFMFPFILRFLPSHFNLLPKTNRKSIATQEHSNISTSSVN